jgi:hypothetical protein
MHCKCQTDLGPINTAEWNNINLSKAIETFHRTCFRQQAQEHTHTLSPYCTSDDILVAADWTEILAGLGCQNIMKVDGKLMRGYTCGVRWAGDYCSSSLQLQLM